MKPHGPEDTACFIRGTKPPAGTSDYLQRIVDDYIRNRQRSAEKELRWFAIQPDLRKAIEIAALAKSPSGKRLSHQRRIPERVLGESYEKLLSRMSELQACSSFEELHEVIERTIGPTHGIGPLTVYDTALRIGSFLRLEPSKVFLHAGTRIGAHYLGLNISGKFLEVSDLPPEFRILKPREIEDVLCIYKKRFSRVPEMGKLP